MLHDDWFDIYFYESHESQYNTIMHETHYPHGEKTVIYSTNSCIMSDAGFYYIF